MKKFPIINTFPLLYILLFMSISCKKSSDSPTIFPNGTITDIDGNVYNVVTIGSQTWMKENLKTSRFNDGTTINLVSDGLAWARTSTPGYCWYYNNIVNKDIYGAMYNWYSVGTKKLCPVGWHVPDNNDWTTLINFLGGESIAGGKLKETGTNHWTSPNDGATNESLFTGLPGGYRSYKDGVFFSIGDNCSWWSSTYIDNTTAKLRALTNYGTSDVQNVDAHTGYGVYVRCVKD